MFRGGERRVIRFELRSVVTRHALVEVKIQQQLRADSQVCDLQEICRRSG